MSDERPTLEYRHETVVTTRKMVVQCIVSTLGMATLVVILVFGVLLVGFAEGESGHDSWGFPLAALAGGGALLVVPTFVAYRCYRNPAKRGYAFGIWIGLGLGLLVEGLCASGALRG